MKKSYLIPMVDQTPIVSGRLMDFLGLSVGNGGNENSFTAPNRIDGITD